MNDGRTSIRRWLPYILLAAIVLLILLRAPCLLTDPRFWAEEGKVYFARAYNSEWSESIFLPYRGYYSLVPNLACLIAAKAVPLERAPLVTTLAAFLVQLLPHALILLGLRPLLPRLSQRALLSCVVLFVVPAGAIFLNTISSQYHLAVVAFLILLSLDAQVSRFWVWSRRLLIALAGLTGVVSCFLLPLFLLKSYLTRRRETFVLSGLLVVAALVQAGAFIATPAGEMPGRFEPESPRNLASVVIEEALVWPVLGYQLEERFLRSDLERTGAGLAVLVAALVIGASSPRRSELALILAAFCLVALLSTSASVEGAGGPRYAYVPGVILVSFFVRSLYLHRPGLRSPRWLLSLAFLVCSLAVWAPLYRESMSPWVSGTWPSWRQEVEVWRKTPGYRIRIWPQDGTDKWVVDLRESSAPPVAPSVSE